MAIEERTNQGLMVYLSQNPCLEENSARFYDALIDLQKAIGCEYKKVDENDRQFDRFIGQTYIKAMTHRNDGRTVIILGKDHHGTTGQNYFDIDPDPYKNETGRGFGDLVRWGHLGNSINDGILLVDFEINANSVAGVARTPQEVQQLLRFLQNYHFDQSKQVYLTESARIYEPEFGRGIRSVGIKTLGDWVNHEFDKISSPQVEQPSTKKTKPHKEISTPQPVYSGGFGGGSLRSSSLW